MALAKRGSVALAAFRFLLALAAVGARQASAAPSPVGPQRVIFIPIDLGTTLDELCPYGPYAWGRPCPVDSQTVTVYKKPRHTAHEWDVLLNDYGSRYWQLASYGQAQVGFTVLENPSSPDGWWHPPHPAQDYENNGDFWIDRKFWGYIEDPARGAIDATCANPSPFYQYFCSILGQYDRIVVMTNKKARGGITNTTDGTDTITLPVDDATLDVSITQPALFSSTCGSPRLRGVRSVALGPVDPVEGGSASLGFRARRGSVGIQMVAPADPASDRDASNVVASRFAYQFFPTGSLRPRVTRFALSANEGCEGETVFRVTPAVVPGGWKVRVSPEVVALGPGEETEVTVVVRPPFGAQPGANADIGIAVQEVEDTSSPVPTDDPEHPVDEGLLKHAELLGWMEVFAKVVGEAATVHLGCGRHGCGARPGEPGSVSGKIVPAVAESTVMLEYTWPRGGTTRFVTTDAAGKFTDSFVPSREGAHGKSGWRGRVHVQAFWPGDAPHAPAQSRRCPR